MRNARNTLLVLAGCLLAAGCGTEAVTAPDRPAFDTGGYIGTGAEIEPASGASSEHGATDSSLGIGYLGGGGNKDVTSSPPTQGDSTTISNFGGGYLGGGG
jgi:hypothetical protein